MAITLTPSGGGKLPAAREIPITITGVPSGTNTYWISSNTDVKLFTADPDYIPADQTGAATNTLLATNRNAVSSATISVWDAPGGTGNKLAEGIYTFDFFSLSGLIADTLWAKSTFGLHVNPASTDEVITISTKVQGLTAPAGGGVVSFTTPHDKLQFFDGSVNPPVEIKKNAQNRYSITADTHGNIKLLVGAISAGVYTITLGPTSLNEGLPVTFVFIDLYVAGQLQPTIVGSDGKLPLDDYPGNNVTVSIPDDVLTLGGGVFSETSQVQVVRVPLDGQTTPPTLPIGGVQTVRDMIAGVPYSKTDFPEGTYYIYHMVYDESSGNMAQSVMTPITVTGSSAVAADPDGTLAKPIITYNVVNTTTIVPYFPVGVRYDGMATGDVVVLEWFADAWVPGSPTKKTGHQPYTKTVGSHLPGHAPSALAFEIPPGDLMNFGAAPGGSPSGKIQFQYTVTPAAGGDNLESQITTKPINTAPLTS